MTFLLQNSECKIQDHIKFIYSNIKCSFTDLIRLDDYNLIDGETTISKSTYKLVKSDVVCEPDIVEELSKMYTVNIFYR